MAKATVMTKRRREILDLILRNHKEGQFPFTIRELTNLAGLKSNSTVHSHLRALERMKLLERIPHQPRALKPTELACGGNGVSVEEAVAFERAVCAQMVEDLGCCCIRPDGKIGPCIGAPYCPLECAKRIRARGEVACGR